MGAYAASDAISLRWPLPGVQLVNHLLPSISFDALDIPAWAPPVMARVTDLDALPPDPRGGSPLRVPDVFAALEFLARNMRADTVPPWIGRLSSGGVQLTWQCGDVEVEAVFDSARDEFEVLVEVAGNEWEAPVAESDSLFAQVVDRLSLAHIEHAAAG